MVLDAHADGVDEDGDHDASVEVLALHDAPQLQPHLMPQLLAALRGTAFPAASLPAFLALLLPARLAVLPVRLLHGSLLCFVVGPTPGWPRPVGQRQRHGAVRTAVGGRGDGEVRRSVVGFIMVGARST